MTDNRWSSLPDAERHWNVGKGLDKAPPDLDLDLDGDGDVDEDDDSIWMMAMTSIGMLVRGWTLDKAPSDLDGDGDDT